MMDVLKVFVIVCMKLIRLEVVVRFLVLILCSVEVISGIMKKDILSFMNEICIVICL